MFKIKYLLLLTSFIAHTAFAQSEYFEEDVETYTEPAGTIESDDNLFLEENTETTSQKSSPQVLEEDVDKLSGIEKFKDIAVIQKKYLDKTGRFEAWGALSLALNSQYFNFLGGNLALTYHFNERWGLELEGLYLSSIEKSITESLYNDQFISTSDIVTPTSYYGINLRWSPVYGKMTLREKTINPFELYFVLGVGLTGTDDGQSAFTIHGGIGQVYPLSKNTTFRWALGLNNFTATAKEETRGSISGKSVNSNLLYLSIGWSIYFPFSDKR